MDIKTGTFVISKAGRGKGRLFITLYVEGSFAWITDGKTRRLDNPKKKKLMHLQPVKYTDDAVTEKLNAKKLLDSDIRKAIQAYIGNGAESKNI